MLSSSLGLKAHWGTWEVSDQFMPNEQARVSRWTWGVTAEGCEEVRVRVGSVSNLEYEQGI